METAKNGVRHEPSDLHDVVLDYITTHAYSSTAKVLTQLRASTSTASASTSSSAMINDSDEDMEEASSSIRKEAKRPMRIERVLEAEVLESIEKRRAILNHILDGAIMRAVDSLNTHFPSVLSIPPNIPDEDSSDGHSASYPDLKPPLSSLIGNKPNSTPSTSTSVSSHSIPVYSTSIDPSHIRLNLQIQQFIESFRQLAPSSPSSPSSSISSLTSSMHMSHPTILGSGSGSGSGVTLTNALTAAQGLHSEAKKLPPEVRAVYLQEIKDVGALFAYTDPENSILKGFLEQGRRIVLAEQVNGAILCAEGRNSHSRLEAYARRTEALYAIMGERSIDPRPLWSTSDGMGREWLTSYWKQQHGAKGVFKLKDYVGQNWA